MGNNTKYYIYSVLWNIIIITTGGAVIQSFLLEIGMQEESVNILLSVMQLVQIFTILLFPKKSDHLKDIIKVGAYLHLLDAPLVAFLLFLACYRFTNLNAAYLILLAVGSIYSLSVGIYSILSYKLPYHIMNIGDYGKLLSQAGVLIGIFCTAFSVLLSFLQNTIGYFPAMRLTYVVILFLLSLFIYVARTFKRVDNVHAFPSKTTIPTSLFRYAPFVKLLIPNLLRGFSLGIANMAVTIGYYVGLLDGKTAGIIVIITNVITIAGGFVYSRFFVKANEKLVILICSIGLCLSLPLMVINLSCFFILYAVAYFFVVVINYAIPIVVTKIIDYDIAGQYSAGRMLLTTAGTSAAGFLCVILFKSIGVIPTLILSGLMQLASGFGYFQYLKNNTKTL